MLLEDYTISQYSGAESRFRANYTQTRILRFQTEEESKSDGADDLTCRKGPQVRLDWQRERGDGVHEEGCLSKFSRMMHEACKT
jgi:hypothetical protein